MGSELFIMGLRFVIFAFLCFSWGKNVPIQLLYLFGKKKTYLQNFVVFVKVLQLFLKLICEHVSFHCCGFCFGGRVCVFCKKKNSKMHRFLLVFYATVPWLYGFGVGNLQFISFQFYFVSFQFILKVHLWGGAPPTRGPGYLLPVVPLFRSL